MNDVTKIGPISNFLMFLSRIINGNEIKYVNSLLFIKIYSKPLTFLRKPKLAGVYLYKTRLMYPPLMLTFEGSDKMLVKSLKSSFLLLTGSMSF